MNFSALDRQRDIYLKGFAGVRPSLQVDMANLEESARPYMSQEALAYIAGGAGSEATLRSNRDAFERCKIIPRMLRNVGARDTSLKLFEHIVPAPVLLAPVGVLELVHRHADLAVAEAATTLGLPFIFSNQASYPMEECAARMANSPRWFQLYWSKSNALVESFVRRAEACGCSAIVVTLDTTMLGWRPQDLNLGYLPFLEGKGIAQYTSDPVFQKMMDESESPESIRRSMTIKSIEGFITMVNRYPGKGFLGKLRSGRPLKAVRKFISTYSNPEITWEDLKFLRSVTKLPLILKGILHPDDARKSLDVGMNGLVVSNHGGRQVDGSIASLDALPGIVKAIDHKIPILLDSGIRGGADIFKALALGATAVCVGRPYAYGLAIGGPQGVIDILHNLIAEFELTMGLAGCKNISEINRDMVVI